MSAPADDARGRRAASPATLGRLAVACAVYYFAVIVILHVVQPDLDPVQHFMSEYVHGRMGFLMVTTFFVLSFGIGALAVALRRTLVVHRTGKFGLILLWLGVIGLVGSGVFPTDPGNPVTTTGKLHVVFGLLGLPTLGAGLILVSLAFRRAEHWRSIAPIALVLAATFLIAFLSIMFVFGGGPGSGVVQRVAIGAVLVWMMFVGHRAGEAA